MNPRRFHWLEKIQVEFAAAAALVVVYFALGPAMRSDDPARPISFLAEAAYGRMLLFALAVWSLAAAAALVTVHARPEGALLAAAVGAGGLSLRSPRIEALLWERGESLGGLFLELIVEVVVLAVILAAAMLVVEVVRGLLGRIRPGWRWTNPLTVHEGPVRSAQSEAAGSQQSKCIPAAPGMRLIAEVGKAQARRAVSDADRARVYLCGRREIALCCAFCLVITLAVAVPLMMILLQSAQRGQILFALLASFLIASLVAHQVFPAPYSFAVWLAPVLAACMCYALAALTSLEGSAAWTRVQNYAKSLPLDWLSAGAGGALLGYWISERIHEIRHVGQEEE
jgi:hypothetical protein